MIKTVVSIALPDLRWCDPEDKYDTSLLTASLIENQPQWRDVALKNLE